MCICMLIWLCFAAASLAAGCHALVLSMHAPCALGRHPVRVLKLQYHRGGEGLAR